ncbi:MAG TPA: hypothetical protein VKR06_25585 [Ktedonosporobacter sp.]|nr:hypothetical protein [Ktedonosporobacter sp.]
MLFILLSRRIGGFDLRVLLPFIGRTLLASGAMALVLFTLKTYLDHIIDTTSMPKLLLAGILMALTKLLLELSFGSLAFLVVARLLKMEEMHSGLVGRALKFLRIPWL